MGEPWMCKIEGVEPDNNNNVSYIGTSPSHLSKEEAAKTLMESTMGSLAKIIKPDDAEVEKIQSLFCNQHILCESFYTSTYMHKLMQYNMQKFFANKNLEMVEEFSIKNNSIIPVAVKEKCQCDINKTFDSYMDAYVVYVYTKTKQKICVNINMDRYDKTATYNIYFTDKKFESLLGEWKEFSKKNNFYKGKKIDAGGGFLVLDKTVGWDDLILDDSTKRVIRKNIDALIKHREALKRNNISTKQGIIVSGFPGTGKTLTCRILANELPISVIYVLPCHLANAYFSIASICDMAKDLAPTLLIIEDIDYIAQDRESVGSGNPQTIELMNRMDGIEKAEDIITIATTNMADKLEKSIKNRPGRFDRIINIPLPSNENRKKMIIKFSEKYNLDKNVDIGKIVEQTQKMSGAYIKNLCEMAALLAIEEGSLDKKGIVIVKMENFEEALGEIKNKDYSGFTEFAKDFGGPSSFGFMQPSGNDDKF
jgi:ATP-dependent Zn protease